MSIFMRITSVVVLVTLLAGLVWRGISIFKRENYNIGYAAAELEYKNKIQQAEQESLLQKSVNEKKIRELTAKSNSDLASFNKTLVKQHVELRSTTIDLAQCRLNGPTIRLLNEAAADATTN